MTYLYIQVVFSDLFPCYASLYAYIVFCLPTGDQPVVNILCALPNPVDGMVAQLFNIVLAAIRFGVISG